eukprot:TRINITY_DN10579_c0_g1_i1.p1 TRINITY_DN10579_c0_g1~~TRINITY_DN10579_c0_g1_i1.p1  ORF type:complete len:294 (+),score=83.98 TRINITY_DN10579_c0_g1_i1:200-1081(+)
MEKKSLTMSSSLKLTAKSWIAINGNTGEYFIGCNEHERREIASLTKIMTAYTSMQIINALDINITESLVEVSFDASLMNGTTASLCEGDVLNIYDMLHAMLLPSGNDAAYALAEYFGLLLIELGFKGSFDPIQIFVNEMNKNAKILGMLDTSYANPHGLQNPNNKSSAHDVAKLAKSAMKLPLFADIVKKQTYSCLGQDMLSRQKSFRWTNTNKLLTKGFQGLKTGITSVAGPCLASSYKDSETNIIIVVISCKTPELRWTETIKLKNYVVQEFCGKSETTQGKAKTPPKKMV